jgi:hypothetical protein
VREADLREQLRELCAELDRRALLAPSAVRASPRRTALALVALGLSACVEPRLAATDARVDGRSVDLGQAVAMYSAPGCSFAGRSR